MAPGMREELLAFVSNRGTLLEPDAIEFLLTQRDPVERIEAFLESCLETPFVVTLDDVMRAGKIARSAAAQIATQTAPPPTSLAAAFIPASFRRLEDEADRIAVLLPSESAVASEIAVLDEVIGVVGTVNDRGLVIAQSIVRPDLPTVKAFRGTRHHVRAAFMSDIHVGSRTFLEDKWSKVSSWLGGADEVAASIRYLVVSGDVVDGIGVYPRQDEELAIDDIYGQYEALARMIADLPDRITVVMLPGNHDAVRPAEPQPAFPTSIQHLFDSNVIFAGNPSLLSLEGVRVLAYHGRSMDDLVSAIPGMSYARPIDAMKAMLRMRHLAPIYGGKTPIAPEAEDHLIIEEVPDIFATGHVHAAGVDQYRGVVLVNSSTWQAQTPYQKMRNIEPMPGRLPIVDLASGVAIVREF